MRSDYTLVHVLIPDMQMRFPGDPGCDMSFFSYAAAPPPWHFSRHFIQKVIIIPRQARDKHRESTQKESTVNLPLALTAPSSFFSSEHQLFWKKRKRTAFLLLMRCVRRVHMVCAWCVYCIRTTLTSYSDIPQRYIQGDL